MMPSRGMGDMNPKKIAALKKGGRVRKQPEVNRVIGIDRLHKAEPKQSKIGKRIRSQENFGNLSKFR